MGEWLWIMDWEDVETIMAYIKGGLEYLPVEAKGNRQSRNLDT
jgi:hypothetical protein